jgi:hypothetical protein
VILPSNRLNSAFLDAVLVARDFYKVSGPPPDELPVPIGDFLILKTKDYTSGYLGDGHYIEVRGGRWPKSLFNSMLLRKGERSTIMVHHTLNWCYTRFAIAIELGNIIMADNESFATTDIVPHLTGLLSGISTSDSGRGEEIALPLAIELLMPLHHRAAMEALLTRGATSMEVAEAFRVPQFIAEWSVNGGWAARVDLHQRIENAPASFGLGS